MYRVVMPALEMAQETGRLLRWLKEEGERVQRGEPLMEIETDKVTLEIEAGGSGVLAQVSAAPGDEVPVGQVIALLLAEGEEAGAFTPKPDQSAGRALTPNPSRSAAGALPAGRGASGAGDGRVDSPARRVADGRAAADGAVAASPLARRLAEEHGVDLRELPSASGRISKAEVLAWLEQKSEAEGPVPASPLARRLARERGVELAGLAGSGPDGAVLAGDIPVAAPEPGLAPAATETVVVDADDRGEVRRIVPLTGMRGAIAARTQASAQAAPHIALTLRADMSAALQLQRQLSPAVEVASGHSLTLTTLLARVVAVTLGAHPRLNAHLLEDGIHEYGPVHLGIAVALEDGLLVPVLRDCQNLGLAEFQARLQQLAGRARARQLTSSEMSGGSFTLSNLGMYGIEHFTAVINPPEVAILAAGAVQERVVAVDGRPAVRPMLQLTINVDHRAVDGAVAAAFLRDVRLLLEDPWSLLV